MNDASKVDEAKQHRPTLLFSVTSGIIARNYLAIPNGFLDHAKKKFERIVLVVPESLKAYFEERYSHEQVVIETVRDDIYRFEFNSLIKKVFAFCYAYLIFSDSAKMFAWEGVYFDARPKDTWSGRISYIFKWLISVTIGKSKWVRTRLFVTMDTLIHRDRFYTDIFTTHNPDVVMVPNVDSWQDVALAREARHNGVPSVGVPGSWDHLPKRYKPIKPDHIMVGTYLQKEEAVQYQSYEEDAVTIVGMPYYDAFVQKEHLQTREAFCASVGLDPEKKILFFGSSGLYSPDDADVVDMLYQAAARDAFVKPAQLFIRPYPGMTYEHEKFDRWNDVPNAFVDWNEQSVRRTGNDVWYPDFSEIVYFMNIIHHSDIIVNTYSSLNIEAAYLDTPAISINFDGYQDRPYDRSVRRLEESVHLKNITGTKAVSLVGSSDELFQEIDRYLADEIFAPRMEILKHQMCGPLDGKTGERMVAVLLSMI